MLSASSLRAASSKIRRGFVFDSLRSASETLRYSVALRMVVSMMLAPFERLGWKSKRADTGWRYPPPRERTIHEWTCPRTLQERPGSGDGWAVAGLIVGVGGEVQARRQSGRARWSRRT